ncbi:tetratricopeptide repeat protein [Mucilaginibacter sp. UR6-11]|uniref:tetratricopeptide repeat protein n=1 Tax=Mucilaginibacter sp. UR6-11 TaxID=1435644 RepID=UPI001E48FA65|nr:tetratricopeptide repeat protein [Mucilaginibacter sp. UR6-11]MCC8426638.1 tetratricopeptide repeat protein [Mucilaginibacter sp. UR6-11]
MRNACSILFLLLSVSFTAYASAQRDVTASDTNQVISLNKNGYDNRLTHPQETVADAEKALKIAISIGYTKGIAEAYRIKGIGEYYLNKPDSALNRYFDALTQYEKLADQRGKAKVYNNIGNLYQMVDYDKALEYFKKAKDIAEKLRDKQLIASLYLNIGNIYNRKNMYNSALSYYEKSYELFTQLKDPVQLVQCLQDLGVIHYFLHNYTKAKDLLLEANARAKAMDMNVNVATINMTLTDIYLAESNFNEAEKYIKEGKTYATIIHNEKDIYDYKHSAYELESKRKNYEKALNILSELYKADSSGYKTNVSTRLNFLQQEQSRIAKAAEEEKNAEISRVIFWSVTVAAGLLLIVIVLLVGSVRRKATTNSQLQELNGEISRQKDNLDRINHHLEEIIDERTKDLQVKNKKLSEYSSYLSHQIRGPIATLKGLMNLEKEGLVDQLECIAMMDKCVSEIDEKIIEMSDMLHDPGKPGF